MNEMTEILKELASQLGTTSEYLWAVLIKQAPISGIIGIVSIIMNVALAIPYFKYISYVSKNYSDFYSEDTEFKHWAISIFIGIVLVTITIYNAICFGNIITAFANPEYWALNKILSTIK